MAFASSAWAQGADLASAQALFEEGRVLLQAGKVAQACPKLAESQRLDPATGTLLALAMCHEKEGKLASAWAEFSDVHGRAHRDGRQDREQLAKDRAGALRSRLSTLVIEVPAAVASIDGLEVTRNDVKLGHGAWNAAVPIDGGNYTIKVTAPGRKGWQGTVVVKIELDQARVSVPVLLEQPKEAVAPSATNRAEESPKAGAARDEGASSRGWGATEWGGVALVGAGAIALGTGGYFLASALSHKKDAEPHCVPPYCDDIGLAEQNTAKSRGNVATVLGIAGGALAATGVVMFAIGRSRASASESATSVSFSAFPGSVGGVLTQSF